MDSFQRRIDCSEPDCTTAPTWLDAAKSVVRVVADPLGRALRVEPSRPHAGPDGVLGVVFKDGSASQSPTVQRR